jgi:hypothetical protein
MRGAGSRFAAPGEGTIAAAAPPRRIEALAGQLGRQAAADSPAFTAAVEQVVLESHFLPAEVAGVKVRQRVRIPFEFRLHR